MSVTLTRARPRLPLGRRSSASLSPGLCIIDGRTTGGRPSTTAIVFLAFREIFPPSPPHSTSGIIPAAVDPLGS